MNIWSSPMIIVPFPNNPPVVPLAGRLLERGKIIMVDVIYVPHETFDTVYLGTIKE